ncbi:MAG: FAD:protein FMN transferase [Planctomycetaceae bacterium]|nr:FAD:protein FMN transferase [Planctomycetaceae bacterium]
MSLSRRRFLSLSLGGGAVFVGGGLVWHGAERLTSESAVTRRSWALGSEVSMTVMGLPTDRANLALDAAFAELELVEQVLSLYRPDSQLCRLNRDRVLHQPHPYFLAVLAMAEQTSRQSDGAFDITVQPLWDLFAACQKQSRLPTDSQIAAARAGVDWRAVDCSRDGIRLRAPATAITLNGIAQGFAADRAIAALREHGVEHALVNSGEIGCLGRKPDGRDWTVGVQHPREPDAFVALTALRGRSLATSGDYETTFSADFSKNHIFDPRTGQSPSELASVSIAAPTAMQADALSTTAMVLGADRTLAFIEKLSNVDALLVLKDGHTLRTRGFPQSDEKDHG